MIARYELIQVSKAFGEESTDLYDYELKNYKTDKPIDKLKVGEMTLVEDNDDEYMGDELLDCKYYIKRKKK